MSPSINYNCAIPTLSTYLVVRQDELLAAREYLRVRRPMRNIIIIPLLNLTSLNGPSSSFA